MPVVNVYLGLNTSVMTKDHGSDAVTTNKIFLFDKTLASWLSIFPLSKPARLSGSTHSKFMLNKLLPNRQN